MPPALQPPVLVHGAQMFPSVPGTHTGMLFICWQTLPVGHEAGLPNSQRARHTAVLAPTHDRPEPQAARVVALSWPQGSPL